jgi:hypothetical protein
VSNSGIATGHRCPRNDLVGPSSVFAIISGMIGGRPSLQRAFVG